MGCLKIGDDMYMYEPCIYNIVTPCISIIYDKW